MPIGDRLVINQMEGGIAKSIPMTAAEAKAKVEATKPQKAIKSAVKATTKTKK